MQKFVLAFTLFALGGLLHSFALSTTIAEPNAMQPFMKTIKKDSILRHVVLFKFREGLSEKDLLPIVEGFEELPSKIEEIVGFEWGTNNSPEGLHKGFTHCFLVSFKNESDRDVYLPHPDHLAFVEMATPYIEDVLVMDYWTH